VSLAAFVNYWKSMAGIAVQSRPKGREAAAITVDQANAALGIRRFLKPLVADPHGFGVIAAIIAVADVTIFVPAARRRRARIIITGTVDIAGAAVDDGAADQAADDTRCQAAGDGAAGIVVVMMVAGGSRLNSRAHKGRRSRRRWRGRYCRGDDGRGRQQAE